MKISVALCTYNGQKYINSQIESILGQSLAVDEIVICDDQSTDETQNLLYKYQEQYPNIIKVFVNEENLKSTKNFEKAISLCSGDYIFLSDQDDIWKPNKVEKYIDFFNSNPNADAIFSNADLINDSGQKFTDHTLWDIVFFLEKELNKPIDVFDVIKKKGNIVTGATLCLKKEVISELLPFPDSNHILHDGWIALNLSYKKSLFYITDNLISYRIHADQQIGGTSISKLKKWNSIIRNIFEIEVPHSYGNFKRMYRKYHFNLEQFSDLIHFPDSKFNFDLKELTDFNQRKLIEIEAIIKKRFPIQYHLKKIKNKIFKRNLPI